MLLEVYEAPEPDFLHNLDSVSDRQDIERDVVGPLFVVESECFITLSKKFFNNKGNYLSRSTVFSITFDEEDGDQAKDM